MEYLRCIKRISISLQIKNTSILKAKAYQMETWREKNSENKEKDKSQLISLRSGRRHIIYFRFWTRIGAV